MNQYMTPSLYAAMPEIVEEAITADFTPPLLSKGGASGYHRRLVRVQAI